MLVLARGYQPELLAIKADSLLVIQQLKRIFAIKNAQLKLLHSSIVQQLVPYTYTLTHVLRSYNKEADRLANSGIDTRKKLPPDFLYFLSQQCPSFYQQLALSYDHRKI